MKPPLCRTCGGTRRIWSMRSWFTHDGYYSSTCGYCDGTGHAAVRTDARYEEFQRTARQRIAADKRWASQLGANEDWTGSWRLRFRSRPAAMRGCRDVKTVNGTRRKPWSEQSRVPAHIGPTTRLDALRSIVAAPRSCPDDMRIGHRVTYPREWKTALRVQVRVDFDQFADRTRQVVEAIRKIAG